MAPVEGSGLIPPWIVLVPNFILSALFRGLIPTKKGNLRNSQIALFFCKIFLNDESELIHRVS